MLVKMKERQNDGGFGVIGENYLIFWFNFLKFELNQSFFFFLGLNFDC